MLRIERYLFRTAATAFLAGSRPDGDHLGHAGAQAARPDDQQGPDDPGLSDHHRPRGCRSSPPSIAPVALFAQRALLPQQAQRRQRTDRHERGGRFARAAAAAVPRAVRAGLPRRWRRSTSRSCPASFDAIQALTDAHPRRFHRQFRPARRLHRARGGLRLPLSRARATTGRCAACSSRTAAIPQRDRDLHRRGRRNRRKERRRLSAAAEGQHPAAARLRRFLDHHLRRLCDRPLAVHPQGRRDPTAPRERDTWSLLIGRSRRPGAGQLRGPDARRNLRPADEPALRFRRRADRLRRARRGAHDAAGPGLGDRRARSWCSPPCACSASPMRCCCAASPASRRRSGCRSAPGRSRSSPRSSASTRSSAARSRAAAAPRARGRERVGGAR